MYSKTAAVALSLATITFSSLAFAVSKDEMAHLPSADEISRVTLILTPPGLRTRSAMRESDLLKTGCTFTTSLLPEKKIEIIKLLKENVEEKPEGAGHIMLRHAIYFQLKNGTTTRLTLSSSENPNSEVYGGIDDGNSGTYMPIQANKALLNSLRNWASSNVTSKNFSKSCLASE